MVADITLISPYPEAGRRPSSGVAWYTQGLAHALTEAGLGVTVVAPEAGRARTTEHDGRVRVDRRFPSGASGLMRAAGAAVANGTPVTHVQHETFLYGGPDSVPAMLMALGRLRRRNRGPVVTMHQVVAPESVDRAFTGMHRVGIPPAVARAGLSTVQSSISRLASRVIVHEEAFKKVLPSSVVLPLGSDTSPPPEPGTSRQAGDLRRRLDATGRALVVLCFGFVAPYKGLEPALRAAELAGPRVKMIVAGAEHPRLSGQGYLDGLRDRFGHAATFTGYVGDDDVGAWFDAADVVLLNYPKPFSSSGVLAQAIHHDVPVLLSPALARVVGFPAETAAPDDPAGLARSLESLARERAQLGHLLDLTRRLGAGRSWAEVAERHIAIYEEVIDAQRASGWTHQLRSRR